jgi:uncharacterized protein (TIGR03437 family)
MSITPDGVAPRLQLGIFTRGTSNLSDDRDFAYDGQVAVHEYTHGVTNRLVGGGVSTSCLSGAQSKALDEGWADYFAASYFNDPVQSAYLSPNTTRGIRRASYENYRFTYEDFGNVSIEEHLDGELWAATLWDIRKTLGALAADRLVYAALRLTSCRPTFVDARDAILAADLALNSGANRARLYPIFANHGLGASASGVDGSILLGTSFNAAFDLPAELQAGNRGPVLNSQLNTVAIAGQPFNYRIDARDPDGGTLRFELASGPQGMTVDAASGIVQWTPIFTSERVKIVITDGQGGRLIHGFYLPVVTRLTPVRPATISASSVGLALVDIPAGAPVLQFTLREGTGKAIMVVIGPDGFPDFDDPRLGQAETLSVSTPTPGLWFVLVTPLNPISGVQLMAALPEPKLIPANGQNPGLSGIASSETFYRIVVPPGGSGLQVKLEGGSGDADLVVRRDRAPVCQVFEDYVSDRCFYEQGSFRFGNREDVTIAAPQAGDWYINVTSATGYSGATLTTILTVRPTLTVSKTRLTFSMTEGGATPAAQTFNVADPSGQPYQWTASLGATAPTWLKIDKTSGSGDATISATVSPTGLQPGTYTANIQIAAGGLSQSPQDVAVSFTIDRRPAIGARVSQLDFASAPGADPPVQSLEFTNTGGGTLEWTVTPSTARGGEWLAVDQSRGTGNARLQVIVRARTLPPGAYDGTLTINATGAIAVAVRVRLVIAIPVTIRQDGVRNAASGLAVDVTAPGDLLILTGANLVDSCSTDPAAPNACPRSSAAPWPTELGGIQVFVNDVAAPLASVTPTEIRLLVPLESTGSDVRIEVRQRGTVIGTLSRRLAAQSLAVFTVLDSGAGAGRIFHADGSLVSRAAPLLPDEIATMLASGLGAVDDVMSAIAPVNVFLDGAQATVEASYLEPGVPGAYRIRFRAPSSLGRVYPVVSLTSDISAAPDVSAGGMSLLDITPAPLVAGVDASVTIRGLNLPDQVLVKVSGESLSADVTTSGAFQSLRVTIPGRLLTTGQPVAIRVEDPAAPQEAASNTLLVNVQ